MDRRRFSVAALKFTLFTLAVFPLFVAGIEVLGFADGKRFYDFGAYYTAARRVLGGYPLYDVVAVNGAVTNPTGGPVNYLYAPVVVLLFLPFALFPFEVSVLLWTAFSIGVYCASVLLLLRVYHVHLPRPSAAVVCLATIGFAPHVLTVMAGQISAVLAGMLCLAAWGLERDDRPDGAPVIGAFITLTVIVKAFYAPAGAVLFRDWRRLASAATVAMVGVLVGVTLFGIEAHLDYLEVLLTGKGWGTNPEPPGEWNMLDFKPLYVFGPLGTAIRVILFGGVAAIALFTRDATSKDLDRYVFCSGLLALVIGGPTVNTFVLVALMPAIVILVVTEFRRPNGSPVWILLAVLLVHAHPYTVEFLAKFGPRYFGWLRAIELLIPLVQPAVWGVAILSVLLVVRIYQEITEPGARVHSTDPIRE